MPLARVKTGVSVLRLLPITCRRCSLNGPGTPECEYRPKVITYQNLRCQIELRCVGPPASANWRTPARNTGCLRDGNDLPLRSQENPFKWTGFYQGVRSGRRERFPGRQTAMHEPVRRKSYGNATAQMCSRHTRVNLVWGFAPARARWQTEIKSWRVRRITSSFALPFAAISSF